MKRIVFCCGVLVLAAAAACSLPAVARQTQTPPPADVGVPRGQSTVQLSQPPATPTAPPAKALSIDDLLNKLDSLKAQKAALEKAEKETVELLEEQLRQQKLRLQMLGINVQEGATVPPTPVAPPGTPTVAPPPGPPN